MGSGVAILNDAMWMSEFLILLPLLTYHLSQHPYKWHENVKRRAYWQRVWEVEHASFTPIVLAATGCLAQEATIFYKHHASLLATKWNEEYCKVMG